MRTQQIVDLLNDVYRLDPEFAHDLVERRFDVTNVPGFERHSHIVVYSTGQVGVLGILNGIAAIDGDVIEAVFDDETERLTGFRLRE